MSTSEMIQFGSLLIALLGFVFTQGWLIYQLRKQDRRGNTKLNLFLILGADSLTEDQIRQKYESEYKKAISKTEFRKAVYEMLIDETAYYELNGTYRAHWRNPKKKEA